MLRYHPGKGVRFSEPSLSNLKSSFGLRMPTTVTVWELGKCPLSRKSGKTKVRCWCGNICCSELPPGRLGQLYRTRLMEQPTPKAVCHMNRYTGLRVRHDAFSRYFGKNFAVSSSHRTFPIVWHLPFSVAPSQCCADCFRTNFSAPKSIMLRPSPTKSTSAAHHLESFPLADAEPITQ